MSASQNRTFQIQHYAKTAKKLAPDEISPSMAQHYEFVIDFSNALGRLYIRYFNPPLG
jgi:hypothetical protein